MIRRFYSRERRYFFVYFNGSSVERIEEVFDIKLGDLDSCECWDEESKVKADKAFDFWMH